MSSAINIKKIFSEYNGIMSTAELKAAGIYYKQLQQLLESSEIQQVRRGFYQYASDTNVPDIAVLAKLFPDGVLCMESALDCYGYSDRTPSAWHIAVDYTSTRSRFNISYPIVKPHFLRSELLDVGINETVIDGTTFKIYDRERVICDLLKHRNKIDSEVYNTAIQRYINDPMKNEANLALYSKQLHVERKLMEILGIWL